MSSNLPEFPSAPSPYNAETAYFEVPVAEPDPGAREWIISAILLVLTLASTTFAGLFYAFGGLDFFASFLAVLHKPGIILMGLPFSIPLVSILLAHELGHFLACKYYGMRCTPPYFIPVPVSLAGTFGAFIRIKSHFHNRRALFDIGIAGPLAGFLFILPTLWVGISLSRLIPKGRFAHGSILFGEPLIFRILGKIILGYRPDRQDMLAHPIAMAAWIGLLATSLNLLPIWQLDGGHISYAILGRSLQKRISIVAVIGLILVSFVGWPPSFSLLFFSSLLLIIGGRAHFFHPPTIMEEEEIGRGRVLLGIIALLILILSFTPAPVTLT